MKLRFLLCALALALPVARAADAPSVTSPVARPANVTGFTFVKILNAISEFTLDANGLQVLLMPDHSAPVLTFMVTYRVGSRNEVTGTTGATHLLEHLMFKGSAHFNRAIGTGYDQILEPLGASNNATTWLDRTDYFVTAASDHLPTIVEMEADRMRGLLLHETDRRPEMSVVRNEFERGENAPINALEKEIFAAAYMAQPYHHPTIGWRSDIEKVSIEKLRDFYDTFYWPDNATITVVGDFAPAAALELVKKFYGAIPRSPKPIPQIYTEEPEQTFPRRVGLKRAGQLGVVALAHKIPAGTAPDYPALTVLGSILADGKNSRLYKALTDPGLSTGVSAGPNFNHDATLFYTFIPLAPGTKHEDAEKAALAEIEKLKKDGVTDKEVSTAAAKLLADSAFQRDGTYAIAGNLNECIATGDWTLYYSVDEAVKKVTAAAVQRVAKKYLVEDQSTTGWFVPVLPPDEKP
jgi:zinc protease